MSKEYERIREQALLTDEEMYIAIHKMKPTAQIIKMGLAEFFPKAIADKVAQAQLDELLKTDGIRIEAEKQDIEIYPEMFATGLILPSQAEMEMLRGFLSWLIEEAGFVRCLSKEEK